MTSKKHIEPSKPSVALRARLELCTLWPLFWNAFMEDGWPLLLSCFSRCRIKFAAKSLGLCVIAMKHLRWTLEIINIEVRALCTIFNTSDTLDQYREGLHCNC